MKFFYTLFLSLLMCTSAIAQTHYDIKISNPQTGTVNTSYKAYIFTVTDNGGATGLTSVTISAINGGPADLTVFDGTPKKHNASRSQDTFGVKIGNTDCTFGNLKIEGTPDADGYVSINNCCITATNVALRSGQPTYSFIYDSRGNGGGGAGGGDKEPEIFTINEPTHFNVSAFNASTQRLYMYDDKNTIDLYYNSESIYGDFTQSAVNSFTKFNEEYASFSELTFSVKMSPALTVKGDGIFDNDNKDELHFSYKETELDVKGSNVTKCAFDEGDYIINFDDEQTKIYIDIKNATEGSFAGEYNLANCKSAYVTGADGQDYSFTAISFTLEGDPTSANGWSIDGSGTANGVTVTFSYSNLTYNRFDVNATINTIEGLSDCDQLTMTDEEGKTLILSYVSWEAPYAACSTHANSYDGVEFKEVKVETTSSAPFRKVTGYGVLSTTKDTIAFVGNQSYDLQGTKLTNNIHSDNNHTIAFGDNTYTISIAFTGDFAVEDQTEFTSATFSDGENLYPISDLKFTTTGDAKSSWSISGTGTLAYGTKISFSFAPTIVNITTALYATYYNEDEAVQLQYDAEAYVASVDEEGKLHFDAEYYGDNLIIPAKTPVVLHATQAGPISLFPTSEEGVKPTHTNHLVGAATDITAAEMASGDYTTGYKFYAVTLDKNDKPESAGFYWVAEEGAAFALGAGKAYLPVKVGTNDAARGFSFADALGISDIKAEKEAGVMYNVYGQRIQEAKGLVIRGGKMMFVK